LVAIGRRRCVLFRYKRRKPFATNETAAFVRA
jgi:hypothetical protein